MDGWMHYLDVNKMDRKNVRQELHKNAMYNTQHNSRCMATYFPFKQDKENMLGTAGEVRTNS